MPPRAECGPRPVLNAPEQHVYDMLRKNGYQVLRTGYPDFIVMNGERGWAVEVKSPGYDLSPAQERMHMAFRHLGIVIHTLFVDKSGRFLGAFTNGADTTPVGEFWEEHLLEQYHGCLGSLLKCTTSSP